MPKNLRQCCGHYFSVFLRDGHVKCSDAERLGLKPGTACLPAVLDGKLTMLRHLTLTSSKDLSAGAQGCAEKLSARHDMYSACRADMCRS